MAATDSSSIPLSVGDLVWVKTGLGSHEDPATVLEVDCDVGEDDDVVVDGNDEDDDGAIVRIRLEGSRYVKYCRRSFVRSLDDDGDGIGGKFRRSRRARSATDAGDAGDASAGSSGGGVGAATAASSSSPPPGNDPEGAVATGGPRRRSGRGRAARAAAAAVVAVAAVVTPSPSVSRSSTADVVVASSEAEEEDGGEEKKEEEGGEEENDDAVGGGGRGRRGRGRRGRSRTSRRRTETNAKEEEEGDDGSKKRKSRTSSSAPPRNGRKRTKASTEEDGSDDDGGTGGGGKESPYFAKSERVEEADAGAKEGGGVGGASKEKADRKKNGRAARRKIAEDGGTTTDAEGEEDAAGGGANKKKKRGDGRKESGARRKIDLPEKSKKPKTKATAETTKKKKTKTKKAKSRKTKGGDDDDDAASERRPPAPGEPDGHGGLNAPAVFTVEYSPSGRASCRRCDEPIQKGELRIGHRPLFRGKPGFKVYRHLRCAVFSDEISSASDVDGHLDLSPEHHDLLVERVEESRDEVAKERRELHPDELVPVAFSGEIRSKPEGLDASLLPFQVEGSSWMRHRETTEEEIRGGILADEMGMGKTLQTIAVMLDNRPKLQHAVPGAKHPPSSSSVDRDALVAEEKLWDGSFEEWKEEMEMNKVSVSSLLPRKNGKNKTKKPSTGGARAGTLIVCPLIALTQWKTEIEKFVEPDTLSVGIYHGPNRTSETPTELARKYDVLLTTYQTLEGDFRKMVSPNKVTCPNCGGKFKVDKLRVHLKYFCGEGAQRTEAQARQRRNSDRNGNRRGGAGGRRGGAGRGGGKGGGKGGGGKGKGGKTFKKAKVDEDDEEEDVEEDAKPKVPKRKKNAKAKGASPPPPPPKSGSKSKSAVAVAAARGGGGKKKGSRAVVRVRGDGRFDSESDLSVDDDDDGGDDDLPPAATTSSVGRPSRSAARRAAQRLSDSAKGWTERGGSDDDYSDEEGGEDESGGGDDDGGDAYEESASEAAPDDSDRDPPDDSDDDDDAPMGSLATKRKAGRRAATKTAGRRKKRGASRSRRGGDDDGSYDESDEEDDDDEEEAEGDDGGRLERAREKQRTALERARRRKAADAGKNRGRGSKAKASNQKKKFFSADEKKKTKAGKAAKKGKRFSKSTGGKREKKKRFDASDDDDGDFSAGSSDDESDDDDDDDPVDPLEGIDMDRLVAEAKEGSRMSVLHSLCWWRVVLDEAHMIKSRSSQTAKAAFSLIGIHKWCLSGTPLQNRVGEFYSLIRFLRMAPMGHYFCRKKGCDCKSLHYRMFNGVCEGCGHGSIQHYSHFNKYVLNPIQRDGYTGDGRRAMFLLKNQVLDKCLLRRTKDNRAEDMNLPPRIVAVRSVRLHPVEEDFYNALYTQTRSSFGDYVADGTLLNNYAHIFDLLMRMRQSVDHPYLVVHSNKDADKTTRGGSLVANGTTDCDICHEPPTERVVSSCCRAAFCRSCVVEYTSTLAGAGGGTPCPSCRGPFSIDLNQERADVVDDGTLAVDPSAAAAAGPRRGKSSKGKGPSPSSSSGWMPSLKEMNHVSTGSILRRLNLSEFATSTKIEALTEELVRMRQTSPGSKAIVFSQFVNMLDLIRWRLHSDPCLAEIGLGARALHGGMNRKARDDSLKEFRQSGDVRVLLISLKAGGVALNLTVANHIYLMDPWWNPAAEMQAIDRTHRLGQYRPIRAVRFIAENTVEERILQLQEKKRLVFDGTVGRDAASLNMLTVDDMKALFA